MDKIIRYFQQLDLDHITLIKTGLLFMLVGLLISLFGRFVFGKKSALSNAVSSAIGILFIYALTIFLKETPYTFAQWIPPLPFVTISGDTLVLFSFAGADYLAICSQLLSMLLLAFLVNIVDRWLPQGKNIFTWILFRALTVLIALILHIVAGGLLSAYLPTAITVYAPPILLGILAVMLLTGALKVPVSAVLSSVNPLIAGFYAFFFAHIVGKQITKAVLTTAILAGLVILLQNLGISAVCIAPELLTAYWPYGVVLIFLWFLVGRIL